MTSQPATIRPSLPPCNVGRRKPPGARLCLAFGLLLAANSTGCGPDGAGSVKVGDPGCWRKPPEAARLRKPAGKPGHGTGRGGQPSPAWKSIKSQLGGSPEKG